MVAYKFEVSKRKNKKYDVIFADGRKTVSFGDSRYQQYRDSTSLKAYSNLDHKDKKRRKLYYARHGSVEDSIPYTADWFSKKFLW